MSNLVSQAVTTGATIINCDVLTLPAGPNGFVKIDSEIIGYGSATDLQLIGCTRGAGGTSAATHAVGAVVTSYENPNQIMPSPVRPDGSSAVLTLTDPTAVPTTAQLDTYETIIVVFDSSGTNQSWTLPASASNKVRPVKFSMEAASSGKTLSINSQSVATGTSILFTWDGTAWTYIQ